MIVNNKLFVPAFEMAGVFYADGAFNHIRFGLFVKNPGGF
jgi:hypothetical protein